jgi:SH3-like domain-containing protein
MTVGAPHRLACALASFVAIAAAAPSMAGAGPTQGTGSVTNLPLPRFVSMRADTANARRGPSLDQRVDWEFVRRGLPLEVIAEYGQWRRVRDADGAGGWVHHTLLSGVRTALVRTDVPVPLHAGPSETSVIRAMAEPGVVGRLEACRDAWCEIAAGGVEGWLPRGTIWGVSPDETIE